MYSTYKYMWWEFLEKLVPKDLFFKQPDLVAARILDLPLVAVANGIQVGSQVFAVDQKILIQEERTDRFAELWLSSELWQFLQTQGAASLPLYKLRSSDERLYFAVFKTVQALVK
jgi:hypothetical protein